MKKLLVLLVVFVVVGITPALPVLADGDGVIISDALAQGLGRTFAVGLLACLGLLYKPNRDLGYAIAAAVFTVLVFIAGVQQGTL